MYLYFYGLTKVDSLHNVKSKFRFNTLLLLHVISTVNFRSLFCFIGLYRGAFKIVFYRSKDEQGVIVYSSIWASVAYPIYNDSREYTTNIRWPRLLEVVFAGSCSSPVSTVLEGHLSRELPRYLVLTELSFLYRSSSTCSTGMAAFLWRSPPCRKLLRCSLSFRSRSSSAWIASLEMLTFLFGSSLENPKLTTPVYWLSMLSLANIYGEIKLYTYPSCGDLKRIWNTNLELANSLLSWWIEVQ